MYDDAAQHYQDALNATTDASDRVRLSEKLAYMLSLGTSPQTAAPLFDQVLNTYLNFPKHAEKTTGLLLQLARQRWLDGHTEDALPLLAQAVKIADMAGIRKLRTLTRARMANYLMGLERFEEAKNILQAYGELVPHEEKSVVSTYCMQRAIIAAVYGELDESKRQFARAIASAEDDPDPYQLIAVWNAQHSWMLSLGETELAEISCGRAIFLARKQHIPWLIKVRCFEYADVLFLLGKYEKAHDYYL